MKTPWSLIAVGALLATSCLLNAAPQPDDPPTEATAIGLAGQIDLARLVDLAARRMGVNIRYDANTLQGSTTLRLGAELTDEELWSLTNRVLASQGFTTVRAPGDAMYTVVRLTDAAAATRIGDGTPLPGPAPGFQMLVVRAQHRPTKELIEAVRPLLSRNGSLATELGPSGLILLADLAPKLDEVQQILARIDVPGEAPILEEIPVKNIAAASLAALVSQVAAKRESVGGQKLAGELVPSPDGASLVLVAPPAAAPIWRDLIERLDRRVPVQTASYTPRAFAPSEVANLIDQTIRPDAPAAAGQEVRWKLVIDDLTGSLIITATADQHEAITSLIARLESSAPESRRPMRAFVIRNRSVVELLGVLQGMLGAGVLDAGAASEGGLLPASPALTAPDIGRTDRPIDSRNSPPVSISGQPAPVASSATSPLLGRGTAPARALAPPSGLAPELILTADEATSTIVAIGEARQLAQLEVLIRQLDVRQPQVMLEVLLVSLSEAQSLALGVELQTEVNLAGDTRATLASLFGLAQRSAGIPSLGAGAGFTGLVLNPGDFSIVVRALETLNDGRSMSMPKVLVGNNQHGTFTSVLQQPFASLSTGTATTTTSFGGTLDAGTIATVRPQIAAGDHLLLDYSVQLSSFVGASAGEGLPPPKQTNSVASQVTIPDGHTVVVGGLELLTEADAESRVPLIGGIPLVGELFKNRNRNYGRDRFFVFIRANILRHDGFEDLRYLSASDLGEAEVDDGWPVSRPRVIR